MNRARRVAGATLVVGVLLQSGCGGGTPAGGDPGGRRLHELSNDPVFSATPQGSTTIRVARTPARHQKPGFTCGGWRGPSVVVTFTSSAPPADVYGFYARRAAAAGWRPTARGALGLTDRWAKTYPHGAPATLLLTASKRVYSLSGGVAPVVR